MTDADTLTQLLERVAEATHVGPPPLEGIVAGAERTRLRRVRVWTAALAVAAFATIGGAAMLSHLGREGQGNPISSVSPSPSGSAESTTMTDLQGTWTVRSLIGANGESVLPPSARGDVRLTFASGKLTGTTGCNSVFGTYEQDGENGQDLRFPRDQLGSTLVGCTNEPPLISRLLDVRHVSGSNGARYLLAKDGSVVAELRRPS
jgi:heat shock protein HslJ